MSGYRIQPLTRIEARQVLEWRYPPPFDYYDPPHFLNPEPLVDQFVDPVNGFFSVRDGLHRFVGFCSFGLDGQVLGGHYDGDALDIGLGMKPEFTGNGTGGDFFLAIMGYAVSELGASTLRLTVADFNDRAIRVYAKAGFKKVGQFLDQLNALPHTIMEKAP